jgi:hypothetical protein
MVWISVDLCYSRKLSCVSIAISLEVLTYEGDINLFSSNLLFLVTTSYAIRYLSNCRVLIESLDPPRRVLGSSPFHWV